MNPPISKKFTNYTRSKIRTTLFINFEVNLKRQSSFSYYSLDARRGSASSKICKKDQRFRHLVRLLVSVATRIFDKSDALAWINIENQQKNTDGDDGNYEEDGEIQAGASVLKPVCEKVSLNSALSAFNTVIQWADENDTDFNDLIVLKKLWEQIIIEQIKS
ncbi:hypothetical protein ABEB36_013623 [Hypothenemus hampei]|uniref:Uncharacterized protein n=1 Tax=Hypothenemus hampei TaxID=57062 RepID=A0ABD1E4R6_HYPHA